MEMLERRQGSSSLPQQQPPTFPVQRTEGSPRHISMGSTSPRAERDLQITRGLGWFSIALGLTEIIAPRELCRAIGVEAKPTLVRACGLRELAAGVGILTQPHQPAWLWSRVAGDAMDLSLLAGAMVGNGKSKGATIATAAVAGVTALDVYAANQMTQNTQHLPGHVQRDGSVRVERTLAVNSSPEECYRMWHDFEQLPRFMEHLQSVKVTGDRRSHWVAKGPANSRVEWDAETTDDRPNELLAWRSVEGSQVENAGEVRFIRDQAGRGTMLKVTMQYKPPGGALGATVARLFGEEPQLQVLEDLRRFKRLVETGELPTTEGQPHGQRPAWYRMAGGTNR